MQRRFAFLDGLRGWAAIVVVIVHIFFDVLPPMNIASLNLHLWWPFSGKFAVAIFFIVSGFALSIAYIQSGDRSILTRIGAGRYFRLVIPIFATCALMSSLLNLDLIMPADARPSRFALTFGFDPTIHHLLKFALFDVFFLYSPSDTYAGPLWSMSFELIGSFTVLALLLIAGRPRDRWVIYAATVAFLLAAESLYVLFVIGIVCADLYDLYGYGRSNWWLILFGIGLYAPLLIPHNQPVFFLSVAASFVGLSASPSADAFLSSKISQTLGDISFPVYLLHAPMIFAVGLPIYVSAGDANGAMLVAGIAALIASIVLSIAFVPINNISVLASRYIGRQALLLQDFAKRQNQGPVAK